MNDARLAKVAAAFLALIVLFVVGSRQIAKQHVYSSCLLPQLSDSLLVVDYGGGWLGSVHWLIARGVPSGSTVDLSGIGPRTLLSQTELKLAPHPIDKKLTPDSAVYKVRHLSGITYVYPQRGSKELLIWHPKP